MVFLLIWSYELVKRGDSHLPGYLFLLVRDGDDIVEPHADHDGGPGVAAAEQRDEVDVAFAEPSFPHPDGVFQDVAVQVIRQHLQVGPVGGCPRAFRDGHQGRELLGEPLLIQFMGRLDEFMYDLDLAIEDGLDLIGLCLLRLKCRNPVLQLNPFLLVVLQRGPCAGDLSR